MSDDIVDRLAVIRDWPFNTVPRDCSIEAEDAEAEIVRLRAKVERLTRWQAEASAVIHMWEETWTAIGEPGQLGDRKSAAVATAFLGLRALADQLAEALQFIQDDIETDFGRTLTDDALTAYEQHKEGT